MFRCLLPNSFETHAILNNKKEDIILNVVGIRNHSCGNIIFNQATVGFDLNNGSGRGQHFCSTRQFQADEYSTVQRIDIKPMCLYINLHIHECDQSYINSYRYFHMNHNSEALFSIYDQITIAENKSF